jgi:hypothetical protein
MERPNVKTIKFVTGTKDVTMKTLNDSEIFLTKSFQDFIYFVNSAIYRNGAGSVNITFSQTGNKLNSITLSV